MWAKWSTSSSAKRSCSVCFVQCARRDNSCGRKICGCYSIITHVLTLSIWQFLVSDDQLTRFNCVWFIYFISSFPKLKVVIKSTHLEDVEDIAMTVNPYESFQECMTECCTLNFKCIFYMLVICLSSSDILFKYKSPLNGIALLPLINLAKIASWPT